MAEWISVKGRLPEGNIECLVVLHNVIVNMAIYAPAAKRFILPNGIPYKAHNDGIGLKASEEKKIKALYFLEIAQRILKTTQILHQQPKGGWS